MKKLFFLCFLVLGAAQAFAQQKPSTQQKPSSQQKPTQQKPAAQKPSEQKLGRFSVSYFPGTYEQFQSLMIERGKPAFLLFVSGGHWRSKDFELNLNEDSELVAYIDSNFVAYKVNTNDDYNLPMQFRITDLPSVIILDKNLTEAARMEGKKEPEGLLEILKTVK
jgi:hypothetical protein